ncbi:hypothetical protein [Evansella vedderi]|nr:hypothetical protein [Evansella vedderi]
MDISLVSFVGLLAAFLVFSNFMIYFIFRWVRLTNKRSLQIKLAKIARKWMKTHRTFGIISSVLILVHISLYFYFNGNFSVKAISGLIRLLRENHS